MKSDENKQAELTPEQERAINMLMDGKTDYEVADEIGVKPQTVSRWQRKNSLFTAMLNERRQALWQANNERFRNLFYKAVKTVEENLDAQTEIDKKNMTALTILKTVNSSIWNLNPSALPSTVEAVEKEWDRKKLFNF